MKQFNFTSSVIIILFLIWCIMTSNVVYAQSETESRITRIYSQEKEKKPKKWLIEIGGITSLFHANQVTNYIGFGFDIGLGYRFWPRSFVTFNYSVNSYNSKEVVGTFSYTKTITNSMGTTYTSQHDDGEITRRYVLIPITYGWHYEFCKSDNLCFSLGPIIGGGTLSIYYKYNPSVDDAPKEEPQKTRISAFGINARILYKDRVGLGYRFLLHKSTTIADMELKYPNSHQINLSIHIPF